MTGKYNRIKPVDYTQYSREELMQRIYTLEKIIGVYGFELVPEVHLTKTENTFLGMLYRRKTGVLDRESLWAGLYEGRFGQGEPQIKIIDVFICKLRKKLRPFDVEIETVWGRGYILTSKGRQNLTMLLRNPELEEEAA